MAEADQVRWDERYAAAPAPDDPALPEHFAPFADRFIDAATAIDIACGAGRASVWLAVRGGTVTGYDISPVAVASARALAERFGVSDRCTFEIADFDSGLPAGPQVDLVLCNMFRNRTLDEPAMERLNPNGTLAVAALSQVGADPQASKKYRVRSGELAAAFSRLKQLGHHEGNGIAWFVGAHHASGPVVRG